MFAYDSITVSSSWELMSVSMCYSQGADLIPPCLGYVLYPRVLDLLDWLACFLPCIVLGVVVGGMVMCYPGRQ